MQKPQNLILEKHKTRAPQQEALRNTCEKSWLKYKYHLASVLKGGRFLDKLLVENFSINMPGLWQGDTGEVLDLIERMRIVFRRQDVLLEKDCWPPQYWEELCFTQRIQSSHTDTRIVFGI